MAKYMIIILIDGQQSARFTDSRQEAENIREIAECAMGGYAEIYEWFSDDPDEIPPMYHAI